MKFMNIKWRKSILEKLKLIKASESDDQNSSKLNSIKPKQKAKFIENGTYAAIMKLE